MSITTITVYDDQGGVQSTQIVIGGTPAVRVTEMVMARESLVLGQSPIITFIREVRVAESVVLKR